MGGGYRVPSKGLFGIYRVYIRSGLGFRVEACRQFLQTSKQLQRCEAALCAYGMAYFEGVGTAETFTLGTPQTVIKR